MARVETMAETGSGSGIEIKAPTKHASKVEVKTSAAAELGKAMINLPVERLLPMDVNPNPPDVVDTLITETGHALDSTLRYAEQQHHKHAQASTKKEQPAQPETTDWEKMSSEQAKAAGFTEGMGFYKAEDADIKKAETGEYKVRHVEIDGKKYTFYGEETGEGENKKFDPKIRIPEMRGASAHTAIEFEPDLDEEGFGRAIENRIRQAEGHNLGGSDSLPEFVTNHELVPWLLNDIASYRSPNMRRPEEAKAVARMNVEVRAGLAATTVSMQEQTYDHYQEAFARHFTPEKTKFLWNYNFGLPNNWINLYRDSSRQPLFTLVNDPDIEGGKILTFTSTNYVPSEDVLLRDLISRDANFRSLSPSEQGNHIRTNLGRLRAEFKDRMDDELKQRPIRFLPAIVEDPTGRDPDGKRVPVDFIPPVQLFAKIMEWQGERQRRATTGVYFRDGDSLPHILIDDINATFGRFRDVHAPQVADPAENERRQKLAATYRQIPADLRVAFDIANRELITAFQESTYTGPTHPDRPDELLDYVAMEDCDRRQVDIPGLPRDYQEFINTHTREELASVRGELRWWRNEWFWDYQRQVKDRLFSRFHSKANFTPQPAAQTVGEFEERIQAAWDGFANLFRSSRTTVGDIESGITDRFSRQYLHFPHVQRYGIERAITDPGWTGRKLLYPGTDMVEAIENFDATGHINAAVSYGGSFAFVNGRYTFSELMDDNQMRVAPRFTYAHYYYAGLAKAMNDINGFFAMIMKEPLQWTPGMDIKKDLGNAIAVQLKLVDAWKSILSGKGSLTSNMRDYAVAHYLRDLRDWANSFSYERKVQFAGYPRIDRDTFYAILHRIGPIRNAVDVHHRNEVTPWHTKGPMIMADHLVNAIVEALPFTPNRSH